MRSADVPAVPVVDDRAVKPETGTEMVRGQVRKALPAEPPHADEQCRIASVIGTNVVPGYAASTELLTRVDDEADFATDACVRKIGRDPGTGSRYLEEISFEVKHKQSNADLTERARKLVRRGVRRVFAIHVKEDERGVIKAGPVREWLASEDCWLELHPESEIVDRCLVQPVKVQALLDATEASNQVARALLAQNNPVLVEDRQRALDAQRRALVEAHAREVEARDRALAEDRQRALDAQRRALAEAHAREVEARDRALAEDRQGALDAQKRALAEAHAREMRARDTRAILDLCDVLAIEVTTERRARMDAMTSEELDALRGAIRARRRWPEGL
jgi:hypothetical protein